MHIPFYNNGRKYKALHTESRLIYKEMKNPEAVPEVPKEGKEKTAEGSKNATVKNTAEGTNAKVKNVAGAKMAEQQPFSMAPQRPTVSQHLGNATNALPSISTVGKAALGTAVVLNPVIGIPAVAAGWGVSKVWGFAKKFPGFKQIDSGARAIGNGAMNVAKAGINVATSPLRVGYHVGAAGLEIARSTWEATGGELLKDITMAINHKFNLPDGTNLLASTLIGIKKALVEGVSFPFRLVAKLPEIAGKVLSEMAERPIRTSIGLGLGIAAVTNPALFSASAFEVINKIADGVIGIINWIPSFTGATP